MNRIILRSFFGVTNSSSSLVPNLDKHVKEHVVEKSRKKQVLVFIKEDLKQRKSTYKVQKKNGSLSPKKWKSSIKCFRSTVRKRCCLFPWDIRSYSNMPALQKMFDVLGKGVNWYMTGYVCKMIKAFQTKSGGLLL